MTIYRIYLRDFQGRVPLDTKTKTPSASVAAQAFEDMVNRTDLDGQKLAAVLSYDNRQLAFHRFDRSPGDADYWRDKLDRIEWPTNTWGGPREGSGRTAQTTDGGPLIRKNVNVDETTIDILTRYGDGEFSEGIRRAAREVGGLKW